MGRTAAASRASLTGAAGLGRLRGGKHDISMKNELLSGWRRDGARQPAHGAEAATGAERRRAGGFGGGGCAPGRRAAGASEQPGGALWLVGLATLLLALAGCQTPTGPSAAEDRLQDLQDLASTVALPPQQAVKVLGYWENSLGMRFKPVAGTKVLFCIWETRVQDYAAYAAANSGVDGSWKDPVYEEKPVTPGPTHPVVNVSWQDAKAFCQWLTEKERKDGKLSAGEAYRLPTDAEWSWAVGIGDREGSGTPEEKHRNLKDVYPWGTQWPPPNKAGNYDDYSGSKIAGFHDGYERTSPAGSFNANGQGLYDLGGNVWEWCEDWYDSGQTARVLRGAWCYNSNPVSLLSSNRGNCAPGNRGIDIGFRCVLAGGSSP